jgi:DNA-binding transcriptional LysR family regulator
MTIRHLHVFVMVAELQNMSAAAEKLYISQPTVSQIISELEKHYGVRLFERYPKRLQLTPAGERLLSYARRVLSEFDHLERRMADSAQRDSLRIGATITVGSCMMSELATLLKSRDHGLDLSVCVENTQKIEQKLLQNQLDAAVVEGTIKSTDLITKPIIRDVLVLVCGNDHPFASRQSVLPEELAGQPFILREPGSGTRELFEHFMQVQQIPITVKWESSSLDSIRQAVIANHGLSVLSSRLIQKQLEAGMLRIVPVEHCVWQRDFYLVYHKNKYLSDPMKTFFSCVEQYMQKDLSLN